MTGMNMNPEMGIGAASVPMMAAMMLPSAVPAIMRRAREHDRALGTLLFAGSYLGVWVLVATAAYVVYRPPGALMAGALTVAAAVYELTPFKRACRRRCRERTRSGVRFGVDCVGSSIGLMTVLLALDAMSLALMCVIGALVLAQKLLAPQPAIDTTLAVTIAVVGIAVAAT
jgi:predicted metal-binding membrane protein